MQLENARAKRLNLSKQVENEKARVEKSRAASRSQEMSVIAMSDNILQLRHGFANKMSRLADGHSRMIRQSMVAAVNARVNEALDRAEKKHFAGAPRVNVTQRI